MKDDTLKEYNYQNPRIHRCIFVLFSPLNSLKFNPWITVFHSLGGLKRWSDGDFSDWRSNKALLLQFVKHKTDIWLSKCNSSLDCYEYGLKLVSFKISS